MAIKRDAPRRGLDDALAWAARRAGLKEGQWHAKYLGSSPDAYHSLLQLMLGTSADARAPANDLVALLTARQTGMARQMTADMERLLGSRGAEAYCLSCPRQPQAVVSRNDSMALRTLAMLLRD